MMWNSIADLKENLNKIALDVHDDDDEELSIRDSSVSDRRSSHNFAHSTPHSSYPVANGFGSAYNSEIEHYKSEIRRLQGAEAEIKALSVNYAALLKEKEDQLCRLAEENGILKQNLDATKASLNTAKSDSMKTSSNGLNASKGSDQLSNRQHKGMVKTRSTGIATNNGFPSKEDGLSNGHSNIRGNEKELADLLEEKNQSLAALQATHESQIKQMATELDKEQGKLAKMQMQLVEEQKLNGLFQQELNLLKVDKDRTSTEMKKIHDELNKNIEEIGRLQGELRRRDNEEADDTINNLRGVIATLEEQNSSFKVEKDRIEAALKAANGFEALNKNSNGFSESSTGPGKEMELSMQKLEKDLKQAFRERDKAIQELNRLKQHLLEKESEESEKMDEDGKIIQELQENNEYQRAQISHLEKALKQAIAAQEDVKMNNNSELYKSKEVIDDLNRKLASCLSTIDAKNTEILNLQTALGQYYAEIEAKERLLEDLARAKEELAKFSELLKDAYQKADILKKEKDETLETLSLTERVLAEGRSRVNKLEEDNEKLRRALEQSMTRLNRMSMDSDYFVDRRIVIKLLVTYFQRNHSKEVLDLMVRMLGFSDEDKQRIGLAQQGAGKGVVRGVLGFPGRIVGGILGGSAAGVPNNMASENQSFADLWVDFLLKETEERERRESAEAAKESQEYQGKASAIAGSVASASPVPDHGASASGAPAVLSRSNALLNPNQGSQLARGNFLQSEQFNSEFSTVPLNSTESSQILRQYPRY